MKTHVQTLKEYPRQYFRMLILVLIIGIAGWVARFTPAIGYAQRIEFYPIMVLYALGSVIILWLAGLGKFPSAAVLGNSVAAGAAYALLCFAIYTCFMDCVLLCVLTALAEIALFCLAEYGLRKASGKTVNVPRLLLKGLVFCVLALVAVLLIYREQFRLLPFFRTGTDARDALRSEIMIGTSNSISIICVIWFFALFITEKMADNVTVRNLTALVLLAPLAIIIMLVSKVAITDTKAINYSGSTFAFRIDKKNALWCNTENYPYSETNPLNMKEIPYYRKLCRISGSNEEAKSGKVLYSFRSATGPSYVDALDARKYVTTFADEVILVNRNPGWEFLVPAKTAGMAEDRELLNAIHFGLEKGRLLLGVDCLDYLRRYDAENTADMLERWSRGAFTEGESSRGGWFDLAYFTEWAGKQLR